MLTVLQVIAESDEHEDEGEGEDDESNDGVDVYDDLEAEYGSEDEGGEHFGEGVEFTPCFGEVGFVEVASEPLIEAGFLTCHSVRLHIYSQ